MADRNVSIALTGTNASAIKAIAGVEAAAQKTGKNAATSMTDASKKTGGAWAAVDKQLGAFGVPFAGAITKVGERVDTASGSAKGFGGTLSKIGAVEAAAGVGVLALGMKSFISEARESEKMGRLTGAVLKSTGGIANVTAADVGNLADSLSKKAGVDDEVIQSGENVLLTFTGIRNEAGKGNDVFNQTTASALDMSAALGGDLQGNIMLLGKALNSPAEGLSKLTRAGVTFTAQQKEQIKSLDASGHKLEAQKVILAEVGKEFGGAAAAAADPLQKLDVKIKNIEESIGLGLLPKIEAVTEGVETGVGAFQSFNRELGGTPGKILAVGAAIPVAVFAGEKLWQVGGKVVDSFKKVGDGVAGAAQGLGKLIGITGEEVAAEEASAAAKATNATVTADLTAAETAAAGASTANTESKVAAITTTEAQTAASAGLAEVHASLTGQLSATTIATHALTEADTEQLAVWAALAGEEQAAALSLQGVAAAQTEVAATSRTAASGLSSVALGLTAVVGGFIAGKAAGDKINQVLNGPKPDIDALTQSFEAFSYSGQLGGRAANEFGADLSGLAEDMGKVSGVRIPGTNFEYLRSGARHARTDIAAVNESLTNIYKTQGVKPAYDAFMRIRDALLKLGVPIEDINQKFNPFFKALADFVPVSRGVAAASTGLEGKLNSQRRSWVDLTTAVKLNADAQRAGKEGFLGILVASVSAQKGVYDVAAAQKTYDDAVKKSGASSDEAKQALLDLQSVQISQKASTLSAVDATEKWASDQSGLTDALKVQADALKASGAGSQEYADATDKVEQKQASFRKALETAAATTKGPVHDALVQYLADTANLMSGTTKQAHAIELNVKASSGLTEALKVQAGAALISGKNSDSYAEATANVTQKQGEFRKKLLEAADSAAGPVREKILEYIHTIDSINEKKVTQVAIAGLPAAQKHIGELLIHMGLIPPSKVTTVSVEATAALHTLGLLKAEVAAINSNVSLVAVTRAEGGRASGGPVDAHKTYLVGEEGPEIAQFAGTTAAAVASMPAAVATPVRRVTSSSDPRSDDTVWVGAHGPELVQFDKPAHVFPHGEQPPPTRTVRQFAAGGDPLPGEVVLVGEQGKELAAFNAAVPLPTRASTSTSGAPGSITTPGSPVRAGGAVWADDAIAARRAVRDYVVELDKVPPSVVTRVVLDTEDAERAHRAIRTTSFSNAVVHVADDILSQIVAVAKRYRGPITAPREPGNHFTGTRDSAPGRILPPAPRTPTRGPGIEHSPTPSPTSPPQLPSRGPGIRPVRPAVAPVVALPTRAVPLRNQEAASSTPLAPRTDRPVVQSALRPTRAVSAAVSVTAATPSLTPPSTPAALPPRAQGTASIVTPAATSAPSVPRASSPLVSPASSASTERTAPAVPQSTSRPSPTVPVPTSTQAERPARSSQGLLGAPAARPAVSAVSGDKNIELTIPVSVTGTGTRGPTQVAPAHIAAPGQRAQSERAAGDLPDARVEGTGSGRVVNYNFTVNVTAGAGTHPTQLASVVIDALKAWSKSNGPLPLPIK